MSATNHTVTVELSQYISTDKPTYLTDYNGDMLKIDNAIAADRDSISGVSTVASRADGKADTNKTNIDALNVQLNGDPEDPTDVGIAGDLNAVEGTVNTVTSLIGSGSPTTSDQTIIGAINGLEGSVAPREDSATFANSYTIGAKFARGGTVYEALASITAGTAFASLVLNTDYKVADTLVKQIEDAASGSGVIGAIVNSVEESIAPREDGTTLAASYSVGDQFIRAGVLYEALASLTAGDAFASLTLNTDYKVADTLIEQIKNAGSELPSGYYIKQLNASISATGDGVKTVQKLLSEIGSAFRSAVQALPNGAYAMVRYIKGYQGTFMVPNAAFTNASSTVEIVGTENEYLNSSPDGVKISTVILSTVESFCHEAETRVYDNNTNVVVKQDTSKPSSDYTLSLHYDVYMPF